MPTTILTETVEVDHRYEVGDTIRRESDYAGPSFHRVVAGVELREGAPIYRYDNGGWDRIALIDKSPRHSLVPTHKWQVGDVVTTRGGDGIHLWLIVELLPGGKYRTNYVSRDIGWDTDGITLSEESDGPLLSKVAHLA